MIGVIHYAYGAPKSIDEVEGYFSHILGGKPVPPPLMDNLIKTFKKTGTPDFISATTERIANGLEILLTPRFVEPIKVYNAYKHTAPYIEETIEQMFKDGVTKFVALPINPIYSKTGSGTFHSELDALTTGRNVEVIHLNNWHTNPNILNVYKERVSRAYNWLPAATRDNAHVLFTVHSQPIDPERNEHYVVQFEEMAAEIAKISGIQHYQTTYRSSGGKANWLNPDVKDAMRTLHQQGVSGFVTCELLSLTADVESFFEIGAECQEVANELGVDFVMAEFPADSFDTVYALSVIVENAVKEHAKA